MYFIVGVTFFVCLSIVSAVPSNSLSSSSKIMTKNSKNDALPEGKFESFYDIPINTYREIFIESERNIIKLVVKETESKKKPKLAQITDFLKNLGKKHAKKTDASVKKDSTQSKLQQSQSSNEIKKSTTQSENATRVLSFFDLPPELQNQVTSLWTINDFAKLADVAESDHCESVAIYAREWFTVRIFDDIVNWRQQLLFNVTSTETNETESSVERLKRLQSAADNIVKNIIGNDGDPDYVSPITKAHKFVLLFKFIAAIGTSVNITIENLEYYVSMEYKHMDGIKHFVRLLTITDHENIIQFLKKYFYVERFELVYTWYYYIRPLQYIYLMIMDKSQYLKNQFSLQMMAYIHELQVFVHSNLFLKRIAYNTNPALVKYEKKFNLDWTLFRGRYPRVYETEQFRLEYAKGEIFKLTTESKIRQLALVYGATQEMCDYHESKRFKDLLYQSRINIGLFERHAGSESYTLTDLLKKDCENSKASDSRISHQMLFGMLKIAALSRYRYADEIQKSVKEAKDLKDYLKYLRIAQDIKGLDSIRDTSETDSFIYETFFTYANRPNLFNDMKTIIKINQLHSDLYKWSSCIDFDHKGILKKFRENFRAESYGFNKNDANKNIKQIICLKMHLALTNRAYRNLSILVSSDRSQIQTDEITIPIIDVLTVFDALAQQIGDEISHDSGLMREHFELMHNFSDIIDSHYRKRNDIKVLQQPLNKLNISNTNSLVYLHLLYMAKLKFSSTELPSQMLENLLTLEDNVAQLLTLSPYLHSKIYQRKIEFYSLASGIKGKLNDLVEKFIRLANFQFGRYAEISEDVDYYTSAPRKLIGAIYSAIADDANAVNSIEPETMLRLERFTFEWRVKNEENEKYFQDKLKVNYDKWQTCLKRFMDADEKRLKSERAKINALKAS